MKKAKVFRSTLIASLFLVTACSAAPATTTTGGTTLQPVAQRLLPGQRRQPLVKS